MAYKKITPRVCVVGLDGVPHGLLSRLAGEGTMPATAGLIRNGHLHRMKASLPEISAVSWTDFMTGADSGAHGIFGFTDLKPGSYDLRFPNFLEVKAETFWDKLGRNGQRSIVINQPSTYPARPIPGSLISGFVAVDMARAVYPPSHRAVLDKMGYQIDIDTLRARDDAEFFWRELGKTFDGGRRALDYFWKQDWDYFELVVTGTDRLHHFHWDAWLDEAHPYHRPFLDYYKKVDGLVGEIASRLGSQTGELSSLFLLSDHGFTGIEREVYLNAWLEQHGYLKYESAAPQDLASIASSSRAFVLDPGRVYIHLENRYPRGCVKEADREILKKEISAGLIELKYQGKKVIRRVFDSGEIYHGPLQSQGPDLVVLSENGFDLKGSVKKKEIFGLSGLKGMHTWDDAIFLSSRDYGQDLKISDLAKIILGKFS
jgi:predicted AlkP superfamily phosphohydrolase/phosphomutase